MTWTLVGKLVSPDGMNCRSYFSYDPRDMWSPIKHKVWVVDPVEVRSVQAPEIPLRPDHGQPAIGRITHLERRASDGSIWAVAEIDDETVYPLPDADYYLSVEAVFDEGTGANVEIRGAALCGKSAMSGLWPVTWIQPNGLDRHGKAVWRLGQFQQDLLERADVAKRRRRYGEPILVHDETPSSAVQYELDRPSGMLEYRSATAVDVTGHTLTMLALPHEESTVVEVNGKMVEEICTRGAFAGAERRAAKIKLNRDHDNRRVIGRLTAVDPYNASGLLVEAKVAATALGTESLQLVKDQVLDVSAGFAVPKDGASWETSSRRRLTRCLLHHVSLVPDAAYESARVLGLRQSSIRTPNLDRVRELQLEAQLLAVR